MKITTALSRSRARIYAARNKAYTRLFSGTVPFYIVNEFPKSGGTWLSQMLSDALDVPFPQHTLIRLEKCIVHGHFLSPRGLHNVVVLWRDPRDIIVSLYYHSYFRNGCHNALLVRSMKERLPFNDYRDIRSNLPHFIHFIFNTPAAPRFTWTQFFAVWHKRPDVIHTSYEELRTDTSTTLRRLVKELAGYDLAPKKAEAISEHRSFSRMRERSRMLSNPDVEMPFIREGSIGGWRRNFSIEAEQALYQYCNAAIIDLDYATQYGNNDRTK